MALGDFPSAPKGGLTGFVGRALRQALIEGTLEPGERLIARDLAARLGTSQTPVREALLKLAASGVLEATPGQSFQVPRLTPERFREISDIRKAVEGLAAERAVEAIGPDEIARLETIAAAYRDARRRNEVRQALHLNREFRFLIYERAGMPTLLAMIEALWLTIGPSLNFLFPVYEREPARLHNYDKLIAALRRRDREAVVETIHRAIDEGTAVILEHMQAAEAGQPAFAEAAGRA